MATWLHFQPLSSSKECCAGWNAGNSLEALDNGSGIYVPNATALGNPKLSQQAANRFREGGRFQHDHQRRHPIRPVEAAGDAKRVPVGIYPVRATVDSRDEYTGAFVNGK